MNDLQWNYLDPLAMRNVESARRELGLDFLRRHPLPVQRVSARGAIRWWELKYEEAGRALMLEVHTSTRSTAPKSLLP